MRNVYSAYLQTLFKTQEATALPLKSQTLPVNVIKGDENENSIIFCKDSSLVSHKKV